MNNNISNRQLNISSAGQIALNLDKKDGQDGIISQSVWEEFWNTNDSENQYKGRKEANVGQNCISVRDAMKFIMTRIFNAANSLGGEVNKIGDKWLNGIEKKEQIDANSIEQLNNKSEVKTEQQEPTNRPLQETQQEESAVQTNDFHKLSDNQKQLIQKSAAELINEIENGSVKLPNGADKNRVIEFLRSQNILQIPLAIEIPTTKAAAKQALMQAAIMIPSKVSYTKEELEVKINNIRTKLNEFLKGKTFNGPNGTKVTGEQLLEIINKKDENGKFSGIDFENNAYGSARADLQNGRILMNLNNQPYNSNSDAEIMKIIIHEALHCVYNTKTGNTWDEERCCESQALKLTAEIVEAEKNNPNSTFTTFQTYEHNIEDFANNDQLLNDTIQKWLETGYTNRTQDINGNITIIKDTSLTTQDVLKTGSQEYLNPNNRIEIKSGDEVWIDGKKVTTIGEAKLESALLTQNKGNSNKCTLYKPQQPAIGVIVFDNTVDETVDEKGNPIKLPNTTPKDVEIRGADGRIVKGKIYLYNEN